MKYLRRFLHQSNTLFSPRAFNLKVAHKLSQLSINTARKALSPPDAAETNVNLQENDSSAIYSSEILRKDTTSNSMAPLVSKPTSVDLKSIQNFLKSQLNSPLAVYYRPHQDEHDNNHVIIAEIESPRARLALGKLLIQNVDAFVMNLSSLLCLV